MKRFAVAVVGSSFRTAAAMAILLLAIDAMPSEGGPVVVGCAGGVTGGGRGARLESDGRLYRVEKGIGSTEDWLVQSDPKLAKEIFAELGEKNFQKLNYSTRGNITCSVERDAHRAEWALGDEKVPEWVVGLKEKIEERAWGLGGMQTAPGVAPTPTPR
jgi:hypothetical protein